MKFYIGEIFSASRKMKDSDNSFICCKAKYTRSYWCFCQIISVILTCNRVLGILPIVPMKLGNHTNSCKFRVSKPWLYYSYCIQASYLLYSATTSLMRLSCISEPSIPSDWYVMTFGYMLSDLNNLVILFFGIVHAKRMCKLLNNLSLLYNSSKSLKYLKKTTILTAAILMAAYSVMLASYIYVAYVRWNFDNIQNIYCYMLDTATGVCIRGITVIFPNVQIVLCIILCMIISKQFDYLSQSICTFFKINPKSIYAASIELCSEQSHFSSVKLEQLVERQESLIEYLEEINKCVGLQVLSEISTNLYTIVYYLYRYITASNGSFTSNNREKYHYSISLLYRVAKLLTYLIIGYMVHVNSKKPLKVLKQSKIITYPVQIQQKIQSLILQWSGRTSNLSAFGVLKVGPWLLAPILGDVITYLLVALQFKRPGKEKSTQ